MYKSILIKYLAFDTSNTKIWASWGVSNAKNFGTPLQYRLKYETVQTTIAKIYIIILFTFSLSSSQISRSLRLLSHLCLLYSSSTARRSPKATTWHRRSHKSYHLTPPIICLLYSASGSFFFFLFCSLFLAVVWCVGWAMGGFGWVDWWWVGSDGQIVVHHAASSTSHSQIADL